MLFLDSHFHWSMEKKLWVCSILSVQENLYISEEFSVLIEKKSSVYDLNRLNRAL